jgi:hypothetical protein
MILSNPEEYYRYMRDAEAHTDTVKDNITREVMFDLASRAERGVKKYNTTLGENNHQNMLQHAYEEALDLAQYLKKEITTLNTIQNMVMQYPNDADLGKALRKLYGQEQTK